MKRYDAIITLVKETQMEKMTPLEKMIVKKLRRSKRASWMVD
ncbi:MAG: hypothetical protein PHI47_13275 [Sulfuricurvum sp.]|nr:hypothetical protein [Sulfuricurvum sp.]MDD5161017.1 hypothetical protein [Sulfuricurvum sp.]